HSAVAGGYYIIYLAFINIPEIESDRTEFVKGLAEYLSTSNVKEIPFINDHIAGELLKQQFISRYLSSYYSYLSFRDKQSKVKTCPKMPMELQFGLTPQIKYSQNKPETVTGMTPTIDIKAHRWDSILKNDRGEYIKEKEIYKEEYVANFLLSCYASALEGGLVNFFYSTPPISTTHIIKTARERGVNIKSITKENIKDLDTIEGLTENNKESIRKDVATGDIVLIPEQQVENIILSLEISKTKTYTEKKYDTYKGTAWLSIHPKGHVGTWISGQFITKGGSSGANIPIGESEGSICNALIASPDSPFLGAGEYGTTLSLSTQTNVGNGITLDPATIIEGENPLYNAFKKVENVFETANMAYESICDEIGIANQYYKENYPNAYQFIVRTAPETGKRLVRIVNVIQTTTDSWADSKKIWSRSDLNNLQKIYYTGGALTTNIAMQVAETPLFIGGVTVATKEGLPEHAKSQYEGVIDFAAKTTDQWNKWARETWTEPPKEQSIKAPEKRIIEIADPTLGGDSTSPRPAQSSAAHAVNVIQNMKILGLCDTNGRFTGIDHLGKTLSEIPNSYFLTPDNAFQILIYNPIPDANIARYKLVVKGIDDGNYYLHAEISSASTTIQIKSTPMTLRKDELSFIDLSVNYLMKQFSLELSTPKKGYVTIVNPVDLPAQAKTLVYVDGVNPVPLSGDRYTLLIFDLGSSHRLSIKSPTTYEEVGIQFYSDKKELQANSDRILEVVFKKQYLLHATSNYSKVEGAGWYDPGSTAKISIEKTVFKDKQGLEYIFKGWKGDIQSQEPTFEVLMDSPKNVEAIWQEKSVSTTYTLGIAAILLIVIAVAVCAYMIKTNRLRMPKTIKAIPPLPSEKAIKTKPSVKYCINCGSPISEEATFCPKCGAQQPPTT
ncbi:MAG: zinc ribbon domain-containing protein, partial [Candidatus Bathyarchaeia archaeon]